MDKYEHITVRKGYEGMDAAQEQTRISVIMPCYNAEQYIRECVESIFSQTLREIEVICIDDGSTDRTFEILEEYQKKVSNLKILQQDNQGSGAARNRGIMTAAGEYIAFMDADDFYPSAETLEKMYSTAKQNRADICGGSKCNYCNGVYTYDGFKEGFTFPTEAWMDKKDFPTGGGYWRFIYNTDFLKRNQIFFPNYLRCQDPPFFLRAIACAGRVYCLKEITYVYRKGHKQVPFTLKKAIDHAKGMRDSLMISKKEGLSAAYSQRVYELYGLSSALMYLFGARSEEMREIIHQINGIIADETFGKNEFSLLKEGEEISKYVNQVQGEKHTLLEGLRRESRVLIYGAGTVGKMVYAFLRKNEVVIEAFVVTDVKQNARVQDGIQVRCIDDYIDKKDECMVIIAAFPCLQVDIRNILQEKGFRKIYPISLEMFYLFDGNIAY